MNKIYQHLKEAFSDWNFIFTNELKQIFKDQGVLIFCILLPLFYPLLYTLIYNNETVRNVPIAVVDDSRSNISRDFLRKVDATPDVKIISYCADLQEAKSLVKHRDAYGIIYIPKNFSKNIMQMRQSHVSIFVDMSGFLYYKALLLATTNVSLAENAKIKIQRIPNLTPEQQKVIKYPIAYKEVDLYNPQIGFASFIIPAVLVLIIQQSILLGIGLSAGTAREKNKYAELVPINKHYNGLMRIVFGKGMAYMLIYIWNLTYVLEIVPHIFSLPQIGSMWTLWMVFIPMLLAIIFFSLTVSVLIKQREVAFIAIVFSSIPLLFLSGISWPGHAIPIFWKYFSYLFPSTFGINAYVKINSLGADLGQVKFEWYALWIQTIIYFITTCIVYKYTIKFSRKRNILLRHKIL